MGTNKYAELFVTNRLSCVYYRQASASAHGTAMPVLFLLSGQKWISFPTGATRCPDKCEIWHGTRAKFHIYPGKSVGIQPPKLS